MRQIDEDLFYASNDGDLEKAKHAIEKGANVEAADVVGLTPLHWACMIGHESIVSLLLENGANVNAKDNDGWTPLHLACMCGHGAIVSLLLEKGADPTITDENGKTPLQIAQEKKSKQNCVAVIEQFQRRQQQLKEQKRQEERQRLPQEKESRLGRLLPWRRQQQQEEASAKKKRDKHLSQQQQQDAAVKKEREELRHEREKEELEHHRKEEEELAKMKLQEAEQKQREKEQAAALKKQQEELRRQREKEELERRRQEELAKTEREAEQKRLETETKKELAQKKQEAEQAAKGEEQLTRQQEMETLTQLEKTYSSKFETRASLDRELKRLQDLVNDAKGSFDPALNAEAEIAFAEYQTLLPLCQSPKYASATDLEMQITSLEERIMKMQIGKERTKAAKELYEIMQRLEREQKDVLKIDPNDPMEVVLENETVEHDRQAKDTQFFETFAHAYGNRVTDDFINSFRVELQGTEESHEALMKQIEESIGGTLDAIQGLQSNLDRSLVLLAFLAKGETIPCPKLVWIDASSLQKAVESPLDDADPKAIDLYFLCEDDCTQSHPEPMTIQATKDCLKRLIPIIKVSLVALKLAGDSRGVLLPVPSIKDLDEQLCFLSKVIGHLEDDEMEELLAIAETMYSTAEDDLNSNLGDDRVKEVRQLVGESYRELSKRALNELHCKKWKPYMDPLPSLYADTQFRVKWVCKNHSAALHGARFSSSPESRVFVNTVDIAHGDVFCERESRDSFHPGNVRYRRIIKRITGRDEYSSMKKSEKIDLVNHVIDNEIKGRFIETGNDGRHFALTREEVIAKVNESLLPDRS